MKPQGYDIPALVKEAIELLRTGDRNGLARRFLKAQGVTPAIRSQQNGALPSSR